MAIRVLPCVLAVLIACGSAATEPATQVLLAEIEGDLPHDQRRNLVGVLHGEPVEIAFADGEGRVQVLVDTARMGRREGDRVEVDMQAPPTHLRSVEVKVLDAAGYAITAEVVGNPTNAGSVERPEHTRIVQVTRRKSSLCGESMAQMSLQIQPDGVTRL